MKVNMLNEIKDAINQDGGNVSDVLRKALELGYLLSNNELINWAEGELNGYKSEDSVPEYRRFYAHSYGSFTGPFGSGLQNVLIPVFNLPEAVKEFAENTVITQSVSEIQELVTRSPNGTLTIPWPANFIALSQHSIYERMALFHAYKSISMAAFVSILDQIKTRLLKFVLELQKNNPKVIDNADLGHIDKSEVSENYESYISGSVKCSKEK